MQTHTLTFSIEASHASINASQVLRWPGLSTRANGPSPHAHVQVVLRHSEEVCSAMSLAGRMSPQEGQRVSRSTHSVAWVEGHDKLKPHEIVCPDLFARSSRELQSTLRA